MKLLAIICTQILLACSIACQADHAAAQPPLAEELALEPELQKVIREAILDLESPSFSQREIATRELWSLGLPAAPALRASVAGSNPEARRRSAAILADFDYGITPEAGPDVAHTLRQFREGDEKSRGQLMVTLCDHGKFELLAILLARSTDQRANHALYARSVQSSTLMIELIQTERLEWWIDTVGKKYSQKPLYRVVSEWLTTDGVINYLDERDELLLIDRLLALKPIESNRYTFLRRLLVHREFVDFFSTEQHLDRLLAWLSENADAAGRHDLLMRFLSMTKEITLYDSPSLPKIVRFATERGTPKSPEQVLTYMRETLAQREEIAARMTSARMARLEN